MDDRVNISIGLPTFAFFAILLFWDFSLISTIPFFSALLHECGHLIAMKLCGQKIVSIKILPFGVDIKKAHNLSSYKEDILVCSAGIVTNLINVLLCCFLPDTPATAFFLSSNVLLILINILPIKSLDGGEILERILLLKYDIQTSERVLSLCSFCCIIILGAIAVWLFLNTAYNFTLLLMCMYLFCGIFLK